MNAFWFGLPGSMKCSRMPCAYAQASRARLRNSGPLSMISTAGVPRVSTSRCSTWTTRWPPIEVSTSIARQAPGEVVHHRQEPHASAVLEGVEHEVERPALVDPGGPRERRPAGHAAPAGSAAHGESLLAIQPVDSL